MPVTFGHVFALLISVALFFGLGTARFYEAQKIRRAEARARILERAPAHAHSTLDP